MGCGSTPGVVRGLKWGAGGGGGDWEGGVTAGVVRGPKGRAGAKEKGGGAGQGPQLVY